ncbi:MAG: UDP-glucose 4-epimerase GalE [Elusimicrobia bacterium RIFOXYA2_FULL_39_19]|nr:MAG: UDP-glucose 4-epimerase GalE [Elusimicrobia bacterium RIFOXYA2_FULL_39_19]
MKVLVAGGAGYIGSHMVAELLDSGYEVVVFDNLSKGHREAVLGGEFVEGNLLDQNKLDETFKKYKIDAVMHFAADSLVGESMTKPDKYFRNNVVGGLNLLDAMMKYEVKKFIFSSTAAIFGEPDKIPIEENNTKLPTNTYGESKLAFEKILRWYDHAFGLKYVCLRYFNAAGAHKTGKIGEDHNPESHLIPIVLQVALGKREQIDIFGDDYKTEDGTCVRDYIHITDLAQAHILGLKKISVDNAQSTQYNLGHGQGLSVKQIIKVSEEVTGKKIKVKIAPRRAGDPATLIASSVKIKKELNWKPQFEDIHKIIDSAWQWHKNHPNGYSK